MTIWYTKKLSAEKDFDALVSEMRGRGAEPRLLPAFERRGVVEDADIVLVDAAFNATGNIQSGNMNGLVVCLTDNVEAPVPGIFLYVPLSIVRHAESRGQFALWLGQKDLKIYVERSKNEELLLRLRELDDGIRMQINRTQLLFRSKIRASFPKHPCFEATTHYVEPRDDGIIHYLDYFSDPELSELWVFGMLTETFHQSADLMDVVLAVDPRRFISDDDGGRSAFIKLWLEGVGALKDNSPQSVRWAWMTIDARTNLLTLDANIANPGFVSLWDSFGATAIKPVQSEKGHYVAETDITSGQPVLFSTLMMARGQDAFLESVDAEWAQREMAKTAPLSHIHEMYLMTLLSNSDRGDASCWMRIKKQGPRQVGSERHDS